MPTGSRAGVAGAAALTTASPVVTLMAVMAVTAWAARDAAGWDGVGIALLGLVVAVVLGVVVSAVTAKVAFGRALPAGRRVTPALAAVVCGQATVATWGVPGLRQGWVPTLLLLALGVLLPLALTGHVRRRWVAVPVVVAVALGLVGSTTQRWTDDRERRAELTRFDSVLPLTDGTSLDSPLPGGWRHLSTTWPYSPDAPLRIQWRLGEYPESDEENYVLEVHTQETNCTPFSKDEPRCTVVGQGAHGEVLRTRGGEVLVHVGEVEWRLRGLPDEEDAVLVLDRLEPCDLDAFMRAASRSTIY